MNKEVRITKRIGSIALVVCIILTSLVFSPAVSALDSLEFEDFANIYGAHINFNSKISVKGDGNNTSYVLDVDVYSSYSAHTSNVNILTSKDDYYVVDKPGYYLFELWGANGGDSTGKGGAGGYVYGVMRLEEGQVLYYTLGGEGGKINKPGESGGANGGGGYGDSSTTTVGGGGGYSAIYLFDKTDFEEKYLNSDGNLKSSISDSDRSSKYIMIAGGGGGGGSYGADSSGTPDGGAGGYIGSASGDLVDGYDVSGTFFAGIDGFSSGTSTQYVGKGGTNVPGSIVSSLGNGDSTEQPNDWKGTYNSDLVGGAGGAGNLRGGGGGGGFCGGSGGIQRSSWLASNIGGGGGGSSFVSSQVTYKPQAIAALENDLGARAEEMMIGIENGKGGGEMHLVFLEEQDDAYLKKMDISFARTPYFQVIDISAKGKVWNKTNAAYEERTYTIDYQMVEYGDDPEVVEFIVKDVSLMPEKDGDGRDHLYLSVTFTPKSDFAGGNNVPLLKNDAIVCTPEDTNYQPTSLSFANHCGYVNVPLNINVSPVNHSSQGLDPELIVHKVTELYNDIYKDARDDLDADWRYRFIENIGFHSVKDERGELITTETVSPDETTRYTISLDVTPKAPPEHNYAKIRDTVVAKTFSGISVITITGSGMDTLNKNIVVYEKSLGFEETGEGRGNYIIKLNVSSDSSGSITDPNKFPPKKYPVGDASDNKREDIYTIEETGLYTISISGGNGGVGGNVNMLGTKGGSGGSGGNISATYALQRGTRLKFYAGKSVSEQSGAYKGASGGECSYVAVLKDTGLDEVEYYLLIAAGGGGGGGAYLFSAGKNGSSATATNNTFDGDIANYNGGKGSDGAMSGGGSGGSAHANYICADAELGYRETVTSTLPTGGSFATLECKALGTGELGSKDNLKSYTVETLISKYFTVTGATLDVAMLSEEQAVEPVLTTTEVLDGSGELLYTKAVVTIELEPVLIIGSEGTHDAVYHIEYTLGIVTTPREGFLGGNDVELIYASGEEYKTGMRISQEGLSDFINVDESRVMDYANVEIPENVLDEITFETQDKVYFYGGEPVIKGSLVRTLENLPVFSDWKSDYVKLVDPRDDTTALTPDTTTTYDISVKVAPIYDEPAANIIGKIEPLLKTRQATIHTEAEVKFEFVGITLVNHEPNGPDGEYFIEFSEAGHAKNDYVFNIKASDMGEEHHHHLPNQITIIVGNDTLVENDGYTYNRKNDKEATVTIFANKINANVTVSIAACHESVTLYYVYQNAPESDEATTIEFDRHFSETIDMAADFAEKGMSLPKNDYTHYELVWDYGLENGEVVTTMPKQDLWIIGTYVPKTYTITVDYKFSDGTVAAESQTVDVSYNNEYHIITPIIEGYAPDITTVSGTATENKTVTVTYASTAGQIKIVCLYRHNGETVNVSDGVFVNGEYSATLSVGDTYYLLAPSVAGYNPDTQIVMGTMTEAGYAAYIYYDAQTYVVTFDDGIDGNSDVQKTVKYGEVYGYNVTSGRYDGLPTPVRVGYSFGGWAFENKAIDESSVVDATSNHTLTAIWTPQKFTITVKYQKDDGSEAFADNVRTLDYEAAYSFDSPELRGYTADMATVSGTIPAQNTIVTVIYNRNTYSVTVRFLYAADSSQAAAPKQLALKHGESYSIEVPAIENHHTNPQIETVTGTVDAADVDVTIYYYETPQSMDFTVTWSAMSFAYNMGVWNPQKLMYENGFFTPIDNGNSVTVINKDTSTIPIIAEFKFTPAAEYSTVGGYFTETEAAAAERITSFEIAKGEEKSAYLHLEGMLDDRVKPSTITIGKASVTVRGGKN